MTHYDFSVESLGEAKIPSPIKMSEVNGDGFANYVSDDDRILYCIDTVKDSDGKRIPKSEDTVELAGPRRKIYFNPAHVHAAICTCGGICPGLNNVIRAIVRCLWYRYGVRRISGIRYGYQGLLPTSMEAPLELDPDLVDEIQEKGGTILGSARGGGEQTADIVDTLERMNSVEMIGHRAVQAGRIEFGGAHLVFEAEIYDSIVRCLGDIPKGCLAK